MKWTDPLKGTVVKTHTRKNSLKKSICIKEVKSIINKLPMQNAPGLNEFTGSFYKTFKAEVITFYDFLLKIEVEEIFLNSFYEASITLIQKSGKDYKKENYKPVSLGNIDTKIFNKILANSIQQK